MAWDDYTNNNNQISASTAVLTTSATQDHLLAILNPGGDIETNLFVVHPKLNRVTEDSLGNGNLHLGLDIGHGRREHIGENITEAAAKTETAKIKPCTPTF
jgi:hypothetical protein